MSDEGVQVADIQDRFLFSLSQLSTAFGPARETVSKRLQIAGVAPRGKRHGHDVYHIGDAAAVILAGNLPTFEGIEDPDKLAPKDRLDWFKSENERRKLERDEGGLVASLEVRTEIAGVVKLVTQMLDTLPDILERDCRLSIDVVGKVEEQIDALRHDLAEVLTK